MVRNADASGEINKEIFAPVLSLRETAVSKVTLQVQDSTRLSVYSMQEKHGFQSSSLPCPATFDPLLQLFVSHAVFGIFGESIILLVLSKFPPGLYRRHMVSGMLPVTFSRKSICV